MLVVTGITGHSGKYFLTELESNGYQGKVRCIVRPNSNTDFINTSKLDVELKYGDLTDIRFLEEALEGASTVFHIASIFYSEFVIKAAVANKVKRAIFVHTTGIYSKYKSASEEYKKIESNVKSIIEENQSDINLTYLRPTMIYGYLKDKNMSVFIKMVDKLRIFPVINNGINLLQPVHGQDLGRAYYQVLLKEDIHREDFVLSGKNEISMRYMFSLISEQLGKRIFFINVPMAIGVLGARVIKFVSLGKIDYIEKVMRMGEDRNFSHQNAKEAFGYDPMPFEEGLKREILLFKASKSK